MLLVKGTIRMIWDVYTFYSILVYHEYLQSLRSSECKSIRCIRLREN